MISQGVRRESRRRFEVLLAGTLVVLAMFSLGIASAAKARILYISDYDSHTIRKIDTKTDTSTGSLSANTGTPPYVPVLVPDGSKLFVPLSGLDKLGEINPTADSALVPISVGDGPYMAATSPDGNFIWVANYNGDTVSLIDARTNAVVGSPIAVGDGPDAIAISPDGRKVYTANFHASTVSVIDTMLKQVVSTIPVGDIPDSIAVTPDGKKAYVANYSSNNVSVIDLVANAVSGPPISTGVDPLWVTVSPDGKTGWVVNDIVETVQQFDTATDTPVGDPIPVGNQPYSIMLTPDGKKAYIPNYHTPTQIEVLNTATRTMGTPIPDPGGPWYGAMTPDQPPVASFNGPASTTTGIATTFDASSSQDPDGNVAGYAWDFGDGTTIADGGPKPSHTFTKAGTFTVKVTETDDEGCSTQYVTAGLTPYCNGSAVATHSAIVTVIDNNFSFGKVKLNRKKGTAGIQVKVPGAGKVSLSGKTVKKASRTAKKKSTVSLPVKAKGPAAKALKQKGKVKVKVKVSFTPSGGKAASKSKTIKLVRR